MHYYQFNIGDYYGHTSRLSDYEDLAYRRLLDLYYLNERPFNGCSTDVAREIGLMDYLSEVEYILDKFFTSKEGEWFNKRCEIEINAYKSKKKSASKAGKASVLSKKNKKVERTLNGCSTTVQRPFNTNSTDVQPNINHKPITNNQEPITKNQKPGTKNQKQVDQDQTPLSDKSDVCKKTLVIFDFWKEILNHPKAKLDDKRKSIIKKCLKLGYSVEDLKSAIAGCSKTPHNIGYNETGQKYDSLTLIFRNADQVDRFMKNDDNPPDLLFDANKNLKSNIKAAESFLENS